MGKTLIIAEKPSVAGDLARVLGQFQKVDDYYESDDAVISSAVGHLLEIKPPDDFEVKRGKWKLENLPALPPRFDLHPVEKTLSRLKLLRRLLKRKDIDSVVNACDAGREGELIFRNIIADSACTKPVRRLWLQSMTPQAIREAYSRLRSDEEMRPLADAAISRSESDWLVGINSTRALTAFNTLLVGGFQKTTAGRVQTPTLAILVEREQKIRAFKPRTYFEVFADFGVEAGSYRGRWFDPTFQKGAEEDARAERIWDAARAESIRARCEGKPGTIAEEKKQQTQAPPLLYDLTTLQREANQRFGLSASRTLQIAQALYERHKVLTYPRTDSRYLPEDYLGNARKVLEHLDSTSLGKHAAMALQKGWVRPNKRIFNNARVSDHFAIVPTGVDPKSLDEFQLRIFELVAKRFVAVFYPAAQFELTTRITTVETEQFKTDGRIITEPGWLAVYGREAETGADNEKAVVPVRAGETATTDSIEVTSSETKPPARFNEATLLSAMEGAGKLIDDEELREAMSEKGLGTPATRASIIEGLLYEGYVERKGRELVALPKGISLITLLRAIRIEMLTRPDLTGEWEHRLREMEHGRLPREEFMRDIRELTADVVRKVKEFRDANQGDASGSVIEGEWTTLDVPCPKCGKGPFKEDYRTFTCQSCNLRLWKSLAGREFSAEEIQTLLTERKLGPLEGFVSRFGSKFSAIVELNDEQKVTFDFGKDKEGEGDTTDFSALTPLAKCPVCATGHIYALEKTYMCNEKASGKCTFSMGRQILKRDISPEEVVALATDKKTSLLKKFISKKGRPFDAHLVLAKGKVGFEFAERKPKAAAKKSPAKKAVA